MVATTTRRASLALFPLLLVTGVAIGLISAQFGMVDAQRDEGSTRIAQSNTATARSFYRAVNEALETGSTDAIDRRLADVFVDHAEIEADPTGAAFRTRILALRQLFPGMTLQPIDFVAQSDRVVARLQVVAPTSGSFVGIPLDPRTAWSTVEILRISEDRVLERWGDLAPSELLEPLGNAPMQLIGARWRVATLHRFTLEHGETVPGHLLAPGMVLIESGRVTVANPPGARSELLGWLAGGGRSAPAGAIRPGDTLSFTAGMSLTLPEVTSAVVRNEEREPATFLSVSLSYPAMGGAAVNTAAASPGGSGATIPSDQILAGNYAATITASDVTISIGRAVLEPGAWLPAHVAGGPELIAVGAGTGAIAVADESLLIRDPNGFSQSAETGRLDAGAGVMINAGSTVTLRNDGDGPLELILVTIQATSPLSEASPSA